MKLAKFVSINDGYTYESVLEEWAERSTYVRVSEYVDVEFPPLKDDERVRKQLDALDTAETELRTKFESALGVIERQRAELRAITYRPE